MALGYDGSIRIDSKIDTKGFNAGIRSMTASVKKLGVLLGFVLGAAGITMFAKSAVNAAADLANALTGLQSVTQGLGKSFSEAKDFINEYTADGLIPATNAIIAYKNLALRGYDTSQIEQVLTALKDSAAFGRQSSYTMGDAIQSASEGLKNENSILVDNAGVTKNVAQMWKEYAQSIGTTANNLTQQQKIQAEVNGILAETRFQTGDAAKLAGGYSGMVAALGTSFYNLRVALGNALIPILAAIIPYIKAVIDWLVVLFNQFAQVIALLFGVEIGVSSAGASAGATADAMGGVGDAAQGAAGGAGALAENTDAAAKAAKGALAAFDELNVLQMETPPTPTGGSGGSGGAGVPDIGGVGAGAFGDSVISDEISNMAEKVAALKEKLKNLFEPTIISLRHLWEALKPVGTFVAVGAVDFYEHFLVPVGTWVLGEGLPRFIDAIANGLETIDWPSINTALVELWDALAPFAVNVGEGLLWLWENVLVPLAAWTITSVLPKFLLYLSIAIATVNLVLEALAPLVDPLFEKFLKPLAEWAGEGVATALAAFAVAWLAVSAAVGIWGVVAGIAATATAAFGFAVAFLASPIFLVMLAIGALILIIYLLITHWDEVKAKAAEVWENIKLTWGLAWAWFNSAVVMPIKDGFTRMFDRIKEGATLALDILKLTWELAWPWFNTTVLSPIKGGFSRAWSSIKEWTANAWTTIQTTWEGAKEWFSTTVIDPLSGAFTTMLDTLTTGFTSTWQGIVELVKMQVNVIIGFVNGFISAIVMGINTVISALNAIHVEIPSWVPRLGGKGFGVSIGMISAPSIPLLAKGAVIPPNAAFAAILGDQRSGMNIEAPEGLIRQIIREEIAQVQADVRIEFTGSLAPLIRELKPRIDQEHVRIGGSLVKGLAT